MAVRRITEKLTTTTLVEEVAAALGVTRSAAEQDTEPEQALAGLGKQYARALALLPAETAVG